MKIETRISTLDQKLRLWRIIGPLGLVGVVLLYLALAIPQIGRKPTMALCVTVTVGCVIPSLLRWHAFRVERRVLEDLRHGREVALPPKDWNDRSAKAWRRGRLNRSRLPGSTSHILGALPILTLALTSGHFGPAKRANKGKSTGQ